MFGAQQNVRMADLAPSRIGDADDGRLENGRMRQKSAFDLGGIDVLAAGGLTERRRLASRRNKPAAVGKPAAAPRSNLRNNDATIVGTVTVSTATG